MFWRGYVQRRLTARLGFWGVALSAMAYGVVHLASGNLMLIAAAFACGAFWGLLFLRFRSIHVNIVSHALWDVAVFILWPFATGY